MNSHGSPLVGLLSGCCKMLFKPSSAYSCPAPSNLPAANASRASSWHKQTPDALEDRDGSDTSASKEMLRHPVFHCFPCKVSNPGILLLCCQQSSLQRQRGQVADRANGVRQGFPSWPGWQACVRSAAERTPCLDTRSCPQMVGLDVLHSAFNLL